MVRGERGDEADEDWGTGPFDGVMGFSQVSPLPNK